MCVVSQLPMLMQLKFALSASCTVYSYFPVVLSLKSLSCLKTVLSQFLRCLGFGLANYVLEFYSHSYKGRLSQNNL